jgi:hypothetical protein
VPRDQKFVGVPLSEHIGADKSRGYDNCVKSIHSDGLDGVEIFQEIAVFVRKSYVPADVADATARLQSADHIALRQLLVFDTELGVSVDTAIL